MKLPIYDITLDKEYQTDNEKLGIDMIAFTSKPAIIVKGVAYNQQEQTKLFFQDDLKYRITAPVMIPMDIYRKDEDGYEYNTRFTAEVIEQLHVDLMQDLTNKDLFNVNHEASEKVPAFILEAWIVEDPTTDKAKTKYNIDVPKGTLMMTTQVTDKEYYNRLVESGQVGFSIEGFLGLKQIKNNKMDYKLPDGEHLIDGKIYVVKDGEVLEVKEVEAQEEEEVVEEELATEEEVVEEEVVEEMEETPATTETYTKEEIDAKFDELMQMIAELKAQEPTQLEEEEEEVKEQKMNAHDKLKSFMNFNKNRK